jgi:hypothetical protein
MDEAEARPGLDHHFGRLRKGVDVRPDSLR